jgi:hypothetical protein
MKNLYNWVRMMLTMVLLCAGFSVASADDDNSATTTTSPDVQGTVSLYKTGDPASLWATAEQDANGIYTFVYAFDQSNFSNNNKHYFQLKFTVDETEYVISAATTSRTMTEGQAMSYQVNEKTKVPGSTAFEFTFAKNAVYSFVLNTKDKTFTISYGTVDTTKELTITRDSDHADLFLASPTATTAVDGKYTFLVKSNATDDSGKKMHYFYFTYPLTDDKTAYVYALDKNDRTITNTAPKALVCYLNKDESQVKFCYQFTIGNWYNVVVDTEAKTVSVVALPNIAGDLTFVNMSNQNNNVTVSAKDGVYTFESLSFSGTSTSYYFKYNVGETTYYVHAAAAAVDNTTDNTDSSDNAESVRRKEGTEGDNQTETNDDDSSATTTTTTSTETYVVDTTEPTAENGLAFTKALTGTSKITFSLTDRSFSTTDTPLSNGVTAVEADNADAPVVYYNLQGVRVANPDNGIFIRVQGSKAQKVAF